MNTFLDSGRVDASRYTPNRVDFDAGFPQTTLAKIILAVLLGFGALTAVSLLVLWLAVRRRGRLGAKTSAAVRSVYVARPRPRRVVHRCAGRADGAADGAARRRAARRALDRAAGRPRRLPGLARHASGRREAKAIGLAGALAGALVGAWLGFNVLSGLFAVITTIVGATAVSNLALLVLDIAWERQSAPAPESVQSPVLSS